MKKMRHSSHRLRIALLAGASVVALAAASPNASAADMAAPMAKKAPPAPAQVVKDTWTWWLEGGAFSTGGKVLGVPAFDPGWGGEGAVGFDWNALPAMQGVGA